MIDPKLLHDALLSVTHERKRQDDKWGDPPEWPDPDGIKLAVLTEEVGEVAKAMLENVPVSELRAELVQVAAVAVKWIESIDATSGQGAT